MVQCSVQKVLSPLSYESGRAERKSAKARFLLARRALHATNVALHEPTAPYPPEGPYT